MFEPEPELNLNKFATLAVDAQKLMGNGVKEEVFINKPCLTPEAAQAEFNRRFADFNKADQERTLKPTITVEFTFEPTYFEVSLQFLGVTIEQWETMDEDEQLQLLQEKVDNHDAQATCKVRWGSLSSVKHKEKRNWYGYWYE